LAGLHSLSKAHDDKLTSFGDVFSWKYNGKWIVFSVIHLGLFTALNFFLEKRSLNIRRHPYRPPQSLAAAPRLVDGVPAQPPVQFIHQDDPDVAAERVRVASAQQDPIRVVAATKFYTFTRAAVDDVTFSVRPHECFGLLGPNGAGKTTLISGITGEVPLGFGDIQIESKSIYDHDVSTLFRSVALGECMQIDALFDDLTTAELVELFIGLRNDHSDLGAQAAQIGTNAVVTDILDRMRLASHRNKRSKALSGGNKRKLSTATALLTGTHICLLDEPSTGMDPSMRRVLWNVLKQEREERGSSILLTTHSMEEAEATCTRISIMVMGKLQCIGSNQHLKSRYGEAYRLHVVLDLTKATPANIDAFVQKTFGQCVLIEGHGAHGTYDVGVVKSISAAFAALEENMQSLGMLSYSLSQSTLEQIFLQFAKRQEIDPSN
jgi:ABC-type multidrug transport system ATPase subunit